MRKHFASWMPFVALALFGTLSQAQQIGGIAYDPSEKSGPQGETKESVLLLPDWSGAWTPDRASIQKIHQTSNDPHPDNPNVPKLRPKYWAIRMIGKDPKTGALVGEGKNNASDCIPDGMPSLMSLPLGNEFLFTPGRVTIISQNGEVRRVYTDGRRHPADPNLKFEGHSIGYWKDGSLYIDTTSILPAAEFFVGLSGTDKTHVVERIERLKDGSMQIDTIVTNPDVFTQPFAYTRTYEHSAEMEEAICQENNRDRAGTINLTPPPRQKPRAPAAAGE